MQETKRISARDLTLTGMFTAIIIVFSQIVIPIQPVPFSLSLMAIFLTGSLLEPRYAFLSSLAYILLGAFGLPVFAGFKGGIHVLAGMTGGFIIAYPVMAFMTSIFYKLSYKISYKIKNKKSKTNMARPVWDIIICNVLPLSGMIFSLAICYLTGTLWFCQVTGSSTAYAFSVCVVPFIVFDLVKILMAAITAAIIKKAILKNQA